MSTQYKGKKLPQACSNTGKVCPGRLWDLHPWKYFKSMLSADYLNWTCSEPGSGPQDLRRSLPSYVTLGLQGCSIAPCVNLKSRTERLFFPSKHHILYIVQNQNTKNNSLISKLWPHHPAKEDCFIRCFKQCPVLLKWEPNPFKIQQLNSVSN